MYNVYQVDKKQKDYQKLKSNNKLIKASLQNRDILTAKYKDRLNKNLVLLSKDAENIQRRSATPTWSAFSTGKRYTKVFEGWNQGLDTSPANKSLIKLRPRQKNKEIQSHLKFRAKSGIERFKETIQKQKEYLDTSNPPKSAYKPYYKNYLGLEKFEFSGGKEVFDYYHHKTYFKSIESLAMDVHSALGSISREQLNKMKHEKQIGMQSETNENNLEVFCKEDIVPMSTELLEKFGLWHSKKKSSGRVLKSPTN
jgi:hypothetical protein